MGRFQSQQGQPEDQPGVDDVNDHIDKMITPHIKLVKMIIQGKGKITDGPARIMIPPNARQKVVPGDWVEFWVRNESGTGLLITRIEPLSGPESLRHVDSIRPSPNHPLFPGPVVPIRYIFPASGTYMAYGQLMHQDRVITTQFAIEVGKPQVTETRVLDTDEDRPISRSRLTSQELNGMRIYNSSTSQSDQPMNIRIVALCTVVLVSLHHPPWSEVRAYRVTLLQEELLILVIEEDCLGQQPMFHSIARGDGLAPAGAGAGGSGGVALVGGNLSVAGHSVGSLAAVTALVDARLLHEPGRGWRRSQRPPTLQG